MEISAPSLQSTGLLSDFSKTPVLFPREEDIQQLINRLRNQYLITVSGNPETGKSALLRYGLAPQLDGEVQGQNGLAWRIAICRPGIDPVENLARALARPGVLKKEKELESDYGKDIRTALERDGNGLVKVFEDAIAKTGEKYNLLVVIDQMEDIFRFENIMSPTQKMVGKNVDFLHLLLTAVRRTDIAVYVIFNFNHQYINKTGEYPGLAEAISRSNYPFPELSTREIIIGLDAVLDTSQPASRALKERLEEEILAEAKEPMLLTKVHQTLTQTIDYWQRQGKDREPIGLEHYEKVGPLSTIFDYTEKQFYQKIDDGNGSRKCFDKILRIITQKAGDITLHRPTLLEEILEHFSQEETATVLEVIKKGYLHQPRMLDIISPMENLNNDFSPGLLPRKNTIIDLAQTPMLQYSSNLINLAHHEAHEADIYARLLDNAKRKKKIDDRKKKEKIEANGGREGTASTNTLSSKEAPVKEAFFTSLKSQISIMTQSIPFMGAANQPLVNDSLEQESNVSLYVPPELDFVLMWKEKYQPTEVWARRYDADSREEVQQLWQQSPYALAMNFLEESRVAHQQKMDRLAQKEKEDARKRERTQRIIRWLGIGAGILAIVALWQMSKAKESLNNIELLNFVDALTDAQVVTADPGQISNLKHRIVEERDIDNNEKVIEFLRDSSSLRIDEADLDLYNSLFNSLDQLYDNLRQKGEGNILKEEIDASANIAIKAFETLDSRHDSLFQSPYAYKVLYAHLEAYKNLGNLSSNKNPQVYNYNHGSLIEALASNPNMQKAKEFAYGDREGNIFVTTALGDNLGQNTSDRYRVMVEGRGNRIQSLAYNSDGTLLASGTVNGNVKIWQLYEPDQMIAVPLAIEKTAATLPNLNSPVQFLSFLHDDQHLLLATEKTIYIYDLQGTRMLKKVLPGFISNIAVSADQELLAIGMPTEAAIFQLQTNGHSSFTSILTDIVELPQDERSSIISSLTFSPTNQLVMGSEIGDIWYAENEDNHYVMNQRLPQIHQSTISNLAFNRDGTRLVSSGLDGNMIIWNFHQKTMENEYLQLREEGNGIWTFCFINEAELIATENISLRIWYSNAKSLRNELRNYMEVN